jgi:hypothetical protein
MRRTHWIALIGLFLMSAGPLWAQKQKLEALAEAQIEAIREASIDPPKRIELYAKYIDEHVDSIKSLANRPASAGRARKLDEELQTVTALFDELESNLDVYIERRADLRRALKPLGESADRWFATLRALAGESLFEIARKEAIESCEEVAADAKRLLGEEQEYFKQHKEQEGQVWAEPK